MAKNGEIRQLLGAKLSLKGSRLYAIAKGAADSLSISTSDAILLLAAKNGINLHKQGVPASKIDQIRQWMPFLPQVPSAVPMASPPSNGNVRKKSVSDGKLRSRVRLLKVDDRDAMLDQKILAEMRAMVPVYELLYQIENSMRRFIVRILKAKHGHGWWDAKAPRGLRETAAKRMHDDSVNAWHQHRSSEPIYYLDLDQLPPIVRANQADFVPQFFATQEWFQHFVDELYRSRCVVSHMNPLIQTNIDAVAVRFNQWQQLVRARANDLKTLDTAGLAS